MMQRRRSTGRAKRRRPHGRADGDGGPGGMMMRGRKGRAISKARCSGWSEYLGAYRLAIVIVMVFAIASTVFTIVGPKILGKATTKLFEGVMAQIGGTGTGIDFAYIGNILLTMIGLYLLSALFAYIQGWVMSGVSMKVTYRFRKDIAEKINRMPLRYFDGTNHGEVLSRVTNDVDTVSQTLNQSLIADHHLGDDGDRRADHDAHDQLADDPGGAADRPAIAGVHQADHQALAEVLQAAAGLPGPRQRPRRGDVRRPRGDEGLQRRGEEHREVRRLQQHAVRRGLEVAVPLRA